MDNAGRSKSLLDCELQAENSHPLSGAGAADIARMLLLDESDPIEESETANEEHC